MLTDTKKNNNSCQQRPTETNRYQNLRHLNIKNLKMTVLVEWMGFHSVGPDFEDFAEPGGSTVVDESGHLISPVPSFPIKTDLRSYDLSLEPSLD